MREPKPSPAESRGSEGNQKRRIETQIHRRKKAKAVPPLTAEWDAASDSPPKGLRMPSDKMSRIKDRG